MFDNNSEEGANSTERRRFLKAIGALGVVGLAGCGGDGDDETPTDTEAGGNGNGNGDGDTPTKTETATATATPTETETPTPTESGPTLGDDPAGLLTFDQDTLEPSDGSVTLTGTILNSYLHDIQDGSVELAVSDGWEITDESGTEFNTLGSQASQTAEWVISVPDDASGDYELSATVMYATTADEAEVTVDHTVSIFNEQEAQSTWSAADYDVGENPEDSWEPMMNVDSWDIQEDDTGKYIELGGPGGARSFLRYTEVGPARQVEVRATMQALDFGSGDYSVYVRATDEDDTDSVSAARIDDYHPDTNHRLSMYQNGEWNELVSGDRQIEGDTRYVVRAVYDLDGVRAKWWPAEEDEPDEWHLEADPGLEDPGTLGVFHYDGDACKLYDYAVGTGGADAPSE